MGKISAKDKQKNQFHKMKSVMSKLELLKKNAKLGLRLQIRQRGTKVLLNTHNIESVKEGLYIMRNNLTRTFLANCRHAQAN